METLAPKKQKQSPAASTQRYVDVEEVRDGVIVLKNGSLRAILLVSSLNFDLKSSDEQDAIIAQYQNFLNSLDFPVQILVHSRRFNIEPYLQLLKEKEAQQTNELLRLQISEYQHFIKNLTDVSDIMSKFFYVMVPFAPVEDRHSGFFERISGALNPKQAVRERLQLFETYRSQLWQRVDHVTVGLGGTGVKVAPLNTEEVIELLYNCYNPSLFTMDLTRNIHDIELNPVF
jgi:type IV secretory pathway VirB4 component